MPRSFGSRIKIYTIVGLLLLCGHISIAEGYYDVAAKVVARYNGARYDSIYSLCDAVFKKSITQQQLSDFLSGLQMKNGRIKFIDSVNFTAPATAVFKVYFDKGLLELYLSLDAESLISGMYFLPPKEGEEGDKHDTVVRVNKTPLALPFNSREKWYVFWGGATVAQNYHNATPQQKYAYDFIIEDDQHLSHTGNGARNEDYYDYGKQIFAAADGEVVEVIDGVLENHPGHKNPFNATGNSVVIKVADSEYITYAHLKTYSIKVKPGDKVKKGQLIGLCGNSGNSTEPHLHFQMQTTAMMADGVGIYTRFAKLILYKKFETGTVYDYSPIKGDKVSAAP